MTNCHMYVHASREMTAHLMRCALHNTSQLSDLLTLKAIIKQVILYYTHHTGVVTPYRCSLKNTTFWILVLKLYLASLGRAVTTLFLKSVCYTYILISLQSTRSVIPPAWWV